MNDDNESFEDKIAAQTTKDTYEFFGVRFYANVEQWNEIYLRVISTEEWLEHMMLDTLCGSLVIAKVADDMLERDARKDACRAVHRTFVKVARKVHDIAQSVVGNC